MQNKARTFLQKSSQPAEPHSLAVRDRVSFPVAICNELFEGWPLVDICRFAKSLGYAGLELAPFTLGTNPHRLPSRQRDEIRQTIRGEGLEVVGLHWLLAQTQGLHITSHETAERERARDYLADLARLCADLGAQVLVLGSPQQRSFSLAVGRSQAEEYAIDLLRQLDPLLRELQVVLAVEPLGPQETNFINTAAEAVRLLQTIDSPQIRLHLDVKAMATESVPIREIIASQAKWLAHFHANDPNRLGPGMGTVDYREFWPSLRDNYHGWLSVEVFDFSPGPERIARESIEYLRRIFGAG